jgi:ComF family protein
MSKKAINFFLPPICPVTGELVEENGMVSPQFWQALSFINAPYCDKCGAPFAFEAGDIQCGLCLDNPPDYHMGRSALVYNDASRDIILKFKHGDQTHAVKAFTPWLVSAGRALLETCDIIMPVPLHPFRLIKRRYNQADLIARELHTLYPTKTYLSDGLKRTRNTVSQGHKKKNERKSNIAKAFAVSPKHANKIKGKTILIIDDVHTTGATLNECAKTLLKGGAAQVNVLTLARVVKD